MGAKISDDDDNVIAEINIVPFVDIILVVLIIFMVTTPLIMKPSIKVDLPKAATGETTSPSEFSISVTAAGEIVANGKTVAVEALSEIAKTLINASPQTQAVISADKNVSHGTVVSVIDAVKSGGVHKFAITIDSK